MPAATRTGASRSPSRRSSRVASLARFRYGGDESPVRSTKKEAADGTGGTAGDTEKDGRKDAGGDEDDDTSSLSEEELSFGEDIEDAIVGAGSGRPKKPGTRARGRVPGPSTTAGKRKRAGTATRGSAEAAETAVAVNLPERKKRSGAVGGKIKKEEDESEDEKDVRVRIKKEAEAEGEQGCSPGGKGSASSDKTGDAPAGWEEMYDLVKEMRLGDGPASHAAVDTMGCERLAQAGASARDKRFQTLVALMLSSQTKDTVNAVAMGRLQAELPPHKPGAPAGLNLENLLAVEPARLNELIWQVGFHNNKTRYLQQAAAILRDKWGGDIPPTAEGLMALPGVGPKMAYLCLAAEHGWNRVEGIGVDVHVHRITNLWNWNGKNNKKTANPEATRLALQSWLPRDRWKEINWLLVGFGQKVCLPVGPKCGDCTLGLRGLCRAADRKKVNEGRRRRQEKEEAEPVKTEVKVEED